MRNCLVLLASIATFAACTTTGDRLTMQHHFCDSFQNWIEAGPHIGTNSRQLTIFYPDTENSNTIVLRSLGWNSGCDETCTDKADDDFIEETFALSHYISINEFAEIASYCVNAEPALLIDILDKNAPSVSSIGQHQKADIEISWKRADCGFCGCTKFVVDYASTGQHKLFKGNH